MAVTYRYAIVHHLLCLINDRLIYLEPVTVSCNYVCLNVVPISLGRIISDAMHASPAADHMGEYKTLYHIKLCFFWPRMRSNIKTLAKQYPHGMLTYTSRRRGQYVMFSWHVSSLFTILYTDLWLTGNFTDSSGNVTLMNVMCDMTQFVIVVPVPNETASTLAENFVQHVLLKFGIRHLVILDDGSSFKGFFSTICKALNINYDILAKRSYKGLLVEKLYRFLNKAITIAAEDRRTNDIFVATSIAARYV